MLSPSDFVVTYAGIGAAKCKNSALRLFLLAILSGFLLAVAAAASSSACHAVSVPGLAKLVCALIFPFGLFMIVMTGAELFTGNCLISISVFSKTASVSGMVRTLIIVYLGNFVGSALLALGLVYGGYMNMSSGQLAVYTIQVALNKCTLQFGKALVLAILCNVLVCTAVMCSLCSKSVAGRAIGAYIPICLFILCGFEHCIANMYYIPAGLFAATVPQYAELAAEAGLELAGLNWAAFLIKNLLPVTIGNILGGVGFGTLIWYCHKK